MGYFLQELLIILFRIWYLIVKVNILLYIYSFFLHKSKLFPFNRNFKVPITDENEM